MPLGASVCGIGVEVVLAGFVGSRVTSQMVG